MLFLKLHKLGQMFPHEPEKRPLHMQEHLLRDRASGGDEEEHLLLPEFGKEV